MLACEPASSEHPTSVDVLKALYDGARATCQARRAFAFVADVRADSADALRVELEHQEGLALVVLVPYSRG